MARFFLFIKISQGSLMKNTMPVVETEARNKWWQFFLLYPALAIAIVGAVPTYIELYQSNRKM